MQDNNEKDVLLAGLEGKNFHIDTKGDYLNAKLVIENRLKGLSSIRFGTEYNFSKDRLLYSDYNGNVYPGSLRENIYALFAESDIYITHRLAAKTGVRFERSSQIDQSNIAPRVSVAYKLAKGTQASVAKAAQPG